MNGHNHVGFEADPLMIHARQEYTAVKDKLRKHVEGLTRELYEQLLKKMFAGSSNTDMIPVNHQNGSGGGGDDVQPKRDLKNSIPSIIDPDTTENMDLSTIRDVQTNLRC